MGFPISDDVWNGGSDSKRLFGQRALEEELESRTPAVYSKTFAGSVFSFLSHLGLNLRATGRLGLGYAPSFGLNFIWGAGLGASGRQA